MEVKNRIRKRDVIFFRSGDAFQPYAYSVGRPGSRFLVELRDHKKFLGIKCGGCKKVYIPPRSICGPCYRPIGDWVEVGPLGTLEAFTILRFPFVDPSTGEKKPVPYGYGFIKLDGAGTNLQHFIKIEQDIKMKIGMRLKPVFAENRKGNMRDIVHFESAGDGS